jgi:hypothetical protein
VRTRSSENQIPLRNVLVREVHEGSLAGHFGIQKTLDMLVKHFYWPRMLGTVGKHILKCEVCLKAKVTFHKGEYLPLPTPDRPWEHTSMDFMMALPRTKRGKDSIMEWLLLIDSPRWHILWHVLRLMMHNI